VLRSDVYEVSDDMVVAPVAERVDGLPYVELDSRFYKIIDDFEGRFPSGPPSLKEAERLVVNGDVTFDSGVVVRGSAEVSTDEPMEISEGTVLGD